MENIVVEVDGRNGKAPAHGGGRCRLRFSGWKIASLKVPHDGKERLGSIGIDFDLYLTAGGRLLLFVENWSRRPGGKNYRIFETFDSLDEMKRKVIYEGSYAVELPSALIRKTGKALLDNGVSSVLDEMLPEREKPASGFISHFSDVAGAAASPG